MKRLFYLAIFLSSIQVFATKYTLWGKVTDKSSGEDMISATVYIDEIKNGVVTDVYGKYSITLEEGTYIVNYSYIGFESITKTIVLDKDINLDIELGEAKEIMNAVVVTGEKRDKNVTSTEMSVVKMNIKTIKKMPALMGEVDVIKSIQTMPGVSSVGEGASGFNVRGGGVDQNLVLLDDAPVYNSSHLLGFFSVFNPDAVKDVKLLKGGVPSVYGGRLSSILDIRMKEGNKKKFSGTGGVGTIFSRLALEGPFKLGDKSLGSWIVAGRRSYIDVLAKPFLPDDFSDVQFYFYDFTAKANFNINNNNRLFLSRYSGKDIIDIGFGFRWGNNTNTVRWNHNFNEKLFTNFTYIFSDYDYNIRFGSGDNAFDWNSVILNHSIKNDYSWYVNPFNKIKFGVQSIYYRFEPGNAVTTNDGVTNNISLDPKFALESSAFISNEQKVNELLSFSYGLRYSNYLYLGSGTSYTYGEAEVHKRPELLSTQTYESGEIIQDYHNLEPRFSMKYRVDENSSIKASYNRMSQYVHLVSNTTASTPLDLWTPSTNNIKPQLADQVAGGYFRNFKDNMYETSVELYYKNMYNQIDYRPGANLLLNPYIEAELLPGIGRAYGSEFYIKKTQGKFNGWISYTLARTERLVEGVNNDKWYPSRFDQLHNFSTTLIYELTPKWTLSANWVYTSGTPVTFPTTKYSVQDIVIRHNSDNQRHGQRITPYHRLDIGATRTLGKKGNSDIVFAIYNVYRRRNAFSIFFEESSTIPGNFDAVRYSIIGDMVPSITYNFKF